MTTQTQPKASAPPPSLEPKSPSYLAYAIVSMGTDNLYQLHEIEMTDSGKGVMTGRVVRRSVPNTKDICTGRAISCLEGMDGFGYGDKV